MTQIIKKISNKSEITVDLINQIIDAINLCADELEIDVDVDVECEIETPDITDDKYVTIKIDGVFVGGQPATQYNGQDIYNLDNLVKHLVAGDALMKYEHGVGIDEIHCLQSSTDGEYSKPGNPIADANGTCAWCRVKFADGKLSPWVFSYDFSNASNCASFCADRCGINVQSSAVCRASVFAAAGN